MQGATSEVTLCTRSGRVVGVSDVVVVSGTPDQRISAVADTQSGRISWEQLIAIGLTPRMIRTRVCSGQLRPLHRGVYAVGHATDVEVGNEIAALLACGPDAILSCDTAMSLWGLIPRSPGADIDVTLLGGRYGRNRPGIRVHRSLSLTQADVVTRHRLPVTTPARALLDYAETHTPREVERALDEGLATRIVSRTKVREVLDRCGAGRRGGPILAGLVARRRPSSITRSHAEERMMELIRAAGLPAPETQHPLHGFEADFYWPQADVVVEVDGYQWHSTRSAFERDRRKDRVFRDAGLDVTRLTVEQLEQESLAIVARLARVIAERTAARRSAA